MSGKNPRCPHLLISADGLNTNCALAEFGLYAVLEENGRLKRGLQELDRIVGQPAYHDGILSLEETRLIEVRKFLDALLSHEITQIQ